MNDERLRELLDERETGVRRELTTHEAEVRRLEDRLARGWEGTGALEPELKRHYDALSLVETTFRLRLGARRAADMARRRRPTKADEIMALLADVFGPGDYGEIADKFASWDMGSPRGVLLWLRQYQNEGKLPHGRGTVVVVQPVSGEAGEPEPGT